MLSVEDNEALTRVGPGTVMGDFLRQYWMPALLSEELPEPDCAPIRLRLLCEDLIAFRATSGRVALIQNRCPHRGASLFFGRNEEEGIRCVYHGWKFDPDGKCTDMLSEPEPTGLQDRVRAVTYPCVERGGVVWTYMGDRETPPPLPDIEPNMLPEGEGAVSVNMFDWNWFQCVENNMDTAHQGILHFGSVTLEDALDPVKAHEAYPGQIDDLKYIVANRGPKFIVKETDFGASYGAYRPGDEGTEYYRTMHWMFPWVTTSPVLPIGSVTMMWLNVPLDDTHTMNWTFYPAPKGQSSTPARTNSRTLLPNNADFLGRFRLRFFYESAEEGGYDFGIDRELQKTSRTQTGYTGLPSVPIQDVAITWSQGEIVDRSEENLGTTDVMIVRARRTLLAAARAYRESGAVPVSVDDPTVYRQRSGWALIPANVDFWEYLRAQREEFEGIESAAGAAKDEEAFASRH
jgi:phthalate 4,5-dioxygenase